MHTRLTMPRSSARVARVLSKLGFSLGFSSSKLALAFSKQENGVATGSVSSVSVLRAVLEAGTRPKAPRVASHCDCESSGGSSVVFQDEPRAAAARPAAARAAVRAAPRAAPRAAGARAAVARAAALSAAPSSFALASLQASTDHHQLVQLACEQSLLSANLGQAILDGLEVVLDGRHGLEYQRAVWMQALDPLAPAQCCCECSPAHVSTTRALGSVGMPGHRQAYVACVEVPP